MDKARQASHSSKILVEAGDADGGCSRAYYAMFDAARAALLFFEEADENVSKVKTHRGVIGLFGSRLVRDGPLPDELGRLLRRAETARVTADYLIASIDLSDAEKMAEDADAFVKAIAALLDRGETDEEDSD